VGNFHLEFLTYWSIVAVQHGVRVFRERRERELSLAKAEGRLVQAELTALKMQLEPHFLFNTLNAISALIHEDPEAADAMVVRLGEFLRLTLETAPRQLVPLREGLGFLEKYLAIETVRFPDRLSVSTRVDDRTLDALVPTLCLQPLVENAVRHGVARQPGGGRIEINAEYSEPGRVRITVTNTGPEAPVPTRTGVGLTNTLSRLSQVFGPQYTFDMRPRPGGGLRVEIVVPCRTAADTALGEAR
jgi:LytS/YehU family sensor histidine kinase